MKKTAPISRQSEIVVQELKGEVLIYDLKTNKAFCLNETSALVWKLCDGERTVADISRSATRMLKQPVPEDLVWLAIDQFKKDNLLENGSEVKIEFNGLSRREAIRKVGLASLVALPIISSLIAPTAAMAQSGAAGTTANCSPCTTNADCASGNCQNIAGGGGQVCSASPILGGFTSPSGTDISGGFPFPDAATCAAVASENCCSGTANYNSATGACVCT